MYNTDLRWVPFYVFVLPANLCNERPWMWREKPTKKALVAAGSKQLSYIPHRICLKIKIAQVFFHVFAVFHHPDAGKSAYKQV